jgi:DNA-binding transcriptional MerR regulator
MVKYYTTSEVAKELNIPKSTVQFYKQLGLIEPCSRKSNGYLLFSYGAIKKLSMILEFRKDNISVDDIRRKLKEMRLVQ